jgi:hypothetical protein
LARPDRRWVVWATGAALVGLLLAVVALWRTVEAAQRNAEHQAEAAANQLVAARVAAARAQMARQEFEQAFEILETALATPNATQLDEARLALFQARQGKADAQLDGAAAAVTRRDVSRARQLLQDYLDNPHATRQPRAKLLLDELERAADEEAAVRLLAGATDEQLAAFAATGRLEFGETLTDEGMREFYRGTLRLYLAQEQGVRAARRAAARAEEQRRQREQAEREERLRADPLYVEVTTFAAAIRKQFREQDRQRAREERALELFLRNTRVTDPSQQEKTRQSLRAGREGADLPLLVVRKKAQVKKAFRSSAEHDQADKETFDRLVDEELNRLLAEIKGGKEP